MTIDLEIKLVLKVTQNYQKTQSLNAYNSLTCLRGKCSKKGSGHHNIIIEIMKLCENIFLKKWLDCVTFPNNYIEKVSY